MTAEGMFWQTALLYWREGAFTAARDAANAGLRLNPDHAGLLEALALSLYELEEYGDALHALESATTLQPLSNFAQLVLAELYLHFGLPDSAGTIAVYLAEVDTIPPRLLPRLATILGRLGLNSEALSVCRKLLVERPEDRHAWFGIAFYLSRLEAAPEAIIEALEQAHLSAPDVITYRVNLAALYADVGRTADAYRLIRFVPAEAIHCPRLVSRLLRIFAFVGDARRAREYERWFTQMSDSPPET